MPLNISVIGTNYLGAAHAAGMAELGHRVIGVDIDQARVDVLSSGRSTVFERDLEPMLARHVRSGRLRFTTDYHEIADWADVHFLSVGTPRSADGSADLSQVFAVADRLGPLLTRPTLVAGKSTVPVGTALRLQQRLRELAPAGDGVEVMWNPEFLQEGHAVDDTLRPNRIVLGVQSPQALTTMRHVYAIPISESVPVVECDLATAELIKTAANAFLALKISFINAMAQMCEAAGGDVVLLADALGHDRRIGREFLNAGLGFGGGCLPKDIAALAHRATELGVPQLAQLIEAIETINDTQRQEVAQLAVRALGGDVTNKRVAVLGAAFKPGTDDTRNSPALTVASRLAELGADVRVYDPQARVDLPGVAQDPSIVEALTGADLVLHLTEWPEFRQLDPSSLDGVVRSKVLIDGRLKLHRGTWERAGWTVVQLGRPAGAPT
ncbi:MAG: UDP-glucose/GDP-mannose dehydrogenase family protein [Actinomycetia bacterium]|nr:UDP-glucose/GDP-mannose dehydrogenase family protein [Actinomycetes bacterium]